MIGNICVCSYAWVFAIGFISRISRVQYWDCMHVFSTEHFLHQNGHGFSCSSFIVGRTIDTILTQNIPACDFLHISAFSQCDNFRVRSEVRRALKKGKQAERARWMYPCVRRPSPFPCFFFNFFSCLVAVHIVSLPISPGCTGQHHPRFVCETVLTRRGLLRCDIIENKIRTHLLLGQSYPCCQSRCHTHTTLTFTPKSDIVCWNCPSL